MDVRQTTTEGKHKDMTDQYVQDPLVYTEAELQAKITEATTNLYTQDALYNFRDTCLKTYLDRMQGGIQTALRALISEGTLTKTEALETYNTIADHNGWANIEAITSTYTVEVCFNGDIVLTVSGVEADTEEEATAEVLENLEVDNVRLKFDVSYGDYADEADVWVYDFDATEDLSAVATEEYN